uniref:Uncharacterized protein n=1 Tax=Panagrolaimus sp. ES5 TaxID=591445 RepID=A0AC34FR96_9BILA
MLKFKAQRERELQFTVAADEVKETTEFGDTKANIKESAPQAPAIEGTAAQAAPPAVVEPNVDDEDEEIVESLRIRLVPTNPKHITLNDFLKN